MARRGSDRSDLYEGSQASSSSTGSSSERCDDDIPDIFVGLSRSHSTKDTHSDTVPPLLPQRRSPSDDDASPPSVTTSTQGLSTVGDTASTITFPRTTLGVVVPVAELETPPPSATPRGSTGKANADDLSRSSSLAFTVSSGSVASAGPGPAAPAATSLPTVMLNDIAARCEAGLLSSSLAIHESQLCGVIKGIVTAFQSQNRVLEKLRRDVDCRQGSFDAQLDAVMTQVENSKVDQDRTLQGWGEKLDYKLEQLTTTVERKMKETQDTLSADADQVVQDVNSSIDDHNRDITEELDQLSKRYNEAIYAERQARIQADADLKKLVQDIQDGMGRPRQRAAEPVNLTSTVSFAHPGDTLPVGGGTVTSPMSPGGPAMWPDAPRTHLATSREVVVTSRTVAEREVPSVVKADLDNVQRQIAAVTKGLDALRSDLGVQESKLSRRALTSDVSRKADWKWAKDELAKKVDVDIQAADRQHIAQLYQRIEESRNVSEAVGEKVQDLAQGRMLEDAVEQRINNLTNELFRLDRAKVDRPELHDFIERVMGEDGPTSLRFKCLSCNRKAGPIGDPQLTKKAGLNDFPPSAMFISSLSHRDEEDGAAVDGVGPTQTRKSQRHGKGWSQARGPVETNQPSHKKVQRLYDWLKTRQSEEAKQMQCWAVELPTLTLDGKSAVPSTASSPSTSSRRFHTRSSGKASHAESAAMEDENTTATMGSVG